VKPNKQEARVQAYLYNDMTLSEREAFESECERDPQLGRLLKDELQFQENYRGASDTVLPPGVLENSRMRLRMALRQAPESLLEILAASVRAGLSHPRFAFAAAPVLVIIGIFFGQLGNPFAPAKSESSSSQITSIKLLNFDQTTGRVALQIRAMTSQVITGDYEQSDIQNLLIAAIQPNQSPGIRLETIDVLKNRTDRQQVREALIGVLREDENPAMRLKAMGALVAYTQRHDVRDALRYALQHDPNPGVRIEAINALQSVPDQSTSDLFRNHAQRDSNPYIQTLAVQTLQEWHNSL
jgi:hypothetical protein